VRLEALTDDHVEELTRAADEDRSTYGFTVVPSGTSQMQRHVSGLLDDAAAGIIVPFVMHEATSGRVIGMTRFLSLRTRPQQTTPYALEIGGTWLASSAQRTGVNTETKYLLLQFAFEEWRVARVDFKTDDRNERSKAAILRIGASFEGVLRNWQPSQVKSEELMYRDTAMFSVTGEEWPVVRSRLSLMIR
jgi:RimJ/RimL family protein N-acetyltransferase